VFLGEELQEALRADADPPAEKTLKVELAQAGAFGDIREGGLPQGVPFEIRDGPFDPLVVPAGLDEFGRNGACPFPFFCFHRIP
jgi:hypothetical protein